MIRLFISILLCLVTAFSAKSAFGQQGLADDCGCYAVLAPEVVQLKNQRDVLISYLKIIDEKTFDVLKKEVAGGLNLEVAGISLSAFGDFAEFRRAVKEVTGRETIDTHDRQEIDFLQTHLGKEAIDAWRDCITMCSANGIHVRIQSSDDQAVTVFFKWNAPVGARPDAKVESIQVEGVENPDELSKGYAFKNGQTAIFIYRRKARKAFKIAINAGGFAANCQTEPFVGQVAEKKEKPKIEFDHPINAQGARGNETFVVTGKISRIPAHAVLRSTSRLGDGFRGDVAIHPDESNVDRDNAVFSIRISVRELQDGCWIGLMEKPGADSPLVIAPIK